MHAPGLRLLFLALLPVPLFFLSFAIGAVKPARVLGARARQVLSGTARRRRAKAVLKRSHTRAAAARVGASRLRSKRLRNPQPAVPGPRSGRRVAAQAARRSAAPGRHRSHPMRSATGRSRCSRAGTPRACGRNSSGSQ
jgi:hypothetical protein